LKVTKNFTYLILIIRAEENIAQPSGSLFIPLVIISCLFANNDIDFILLEKSFGSDLSDSLKSNFLLDAHIQLTGKANT